MSSILTFGKAQVSAFIGGISDYAFMVIFTDLFGLHYTVSILLSGSLGAFINFSMNRYWAFPSEGIYQHSLKDQISRFVVVVLGSIALKSAGTYCLVNAVSLNYKISRVLIDLFVSYAFNFPLMKYWVFKSSSIRIAKAH